MMVAGPLRLSVAADFEILGDAIVVTLAPNANGPSATLTVNTAADITVSSSDPPWSFDQAPDHPACTRLLVTGGAMVDGFLSVFIEYTTTNT